MGILLKTYFHGASVLQCMRIKTKHKWPEDSLHIWARSTFAALHFSFIAAVQLRFSIETTEYFTVWASKSSRFWKFVIPRVYHRSEWFKFQLKTERLKHFWDFASCLTRPRSVGKFNFIRIYTIGKGPKTLIPINLVFVRQREKSQKYFNLLTFN